MVCSFLYGREVAKLPYLHDGGEDEHEGEEDEVVEGGGVGHLRKVGPGLEAEERHRKDGGDAFWSNYRNINCPTKPIMDFIILDLSNL